MASNFTSKNISSISLENIIYNLKSVPFHATAAEWELAPLNAYVPKQGEMVVYDKDDENAIERLKIGDGVSAVSNLPFAVPEYEVITPEMISEMIDLSTGSYITDVINKSNSDAMEASY